MGQASPSWPPLAIPQQPLNLSGVPHDLDKIAAGASINFVEVADQDRFRSHYADDDDQQTRVFDVAWSDLDRFEVWARGYSTITQEELPEADPNKPPPLGPPKLRRSIPIQAPRKPWLYCSRVELLSIAGVQLPDVELFAVDGDGNIIQNVLDVDFAGDINVLRLPVLLESLMARNGSNTAQDGLARVAVTYTPRNYEIRNDLETDEKFGGNELCRNVEREAQFSFNNLPFPLGSLCWGDDPDNRRYSRKLVPTTGLYQIMGVTQLAYTWRDVPDIPWTAIQNCLGKTNSITFDGFSGYPAFEPGTVVCLAPRKKRRRNVVGRVVHDITYNFAFREIPWSNFATPAGEFFKVFNVNQDFLGPLPARTEAVPSDRPAIPEADLNSLFVPPLPVNYQGAG